MSGHSKWHNIRVKKEKVDAKRGKVFTRISKEIMLAVKESGPDPDTNFRLATIIQKAKEVNMPNANIQRAIDSASGELSGEGIEEVVYEGYGPFGVAIFIEVATDNKNRTVPEIRNIFGKYGGALGESGCVAWMFDRKGLIMIDASVAGEEEIFEIALEAGAEDIEKEGNAYRITTAFEDFYEVKKALQEKKISMESADITMIPQNEITLNKSQAQTIMKLMEFLEEHDDVQNVFANFDIPDDDG
ncbi:MAG: YebC/PmpR family DNA-binding transcriptional regulator [Candidatus Eremiobacteraeota bacterium]|nr:YebC/PmpR family DNA-binding transcriptional regulator [Candidatus Eremiobacteraeota bacterium]